MDSLVDDLNKIIFDYLTLRDLARLSQTNKRFYFLITSLFSNKNLSLKIGYYQLKVKNGDYKSYVSLYCYDSSQFMWKHQGWKRVRDGYLGKLNKFIDDLDKNKSASKDGFLKFTLIYHYQDIYDEILKLENGKFIFIHLQDEKQKISIPIKGNEFQIMDLLFSIKKEISIDFVARV